MVYKMRMPWLILVSILLLLLPACGTSVTQPFTFQAPPWQNGETSNYVVFDSSGTNIGTATWSWKEEPDGWTLNYDLWLGERHDVAEILLDHALMPVQSSRSYSDDVVSTVYETDQVVVAVEKPDGSVEKKTLSAGETLLDNDQTLQSLRALPYETGYRTGYINFVPVSASRTRVGVKVVGSENLDVVGGNFDTWHVILTFGNLKHEAWYAVQAPHLLVRYKNLVSGAEFQLRSWKLSESASLEGNTDEALTTSAVGIVEEVPEINWLYYILAFLLQYPLMIIFPLILGWWIKKKFKVGWRIFLIGMATFIASQIVHIPFNWSIGLMGSDRGVALLPLPLVAVIAGLSAGVCEEVARWLFIRFFLKEHRKWKVAVQFGAGHGAVEAIIFGLLSLINVGYLFVIQTTGFEALGITGEAAVQLKSALVSMSSLSWYTPILAGAERVFAICMHVFFSVLVMRSFTHKNILYFFAAIGFHALVDFWAVIGSSLVNVIWLEAVLAFMAAAMLIMIIRLKPEQIPTADYQVDIS